MGYSNCNTTERVYNVLSEALFEALAFEQNGLFKDRSKLAMDNIVLACVTRATTYNWTIGVGAGQKPAGNTLQDNVFKGITIDQIIMMGMDNQLINNPAAQGITINSTTGTIDLSAIDGLKPGGPSGISIVVNPVKS